MTEDGTSFGADADGVMHLYAESVVIRQTRESLTRVVSCTLVTSTPPDALMLSKGSDPARRHTRRFRSYNTTKGIVRTPPCVDIMTADASLAPISSC